MFIRATRQVNWDLHLAAFRAMLPWFFICDRVNYARYGSAYLLEMTALENTHPGIILFVLIYSITYAKSTNIMYNIKLL